MLRDIKILLLITVIFFCGCAKTVTPLPQLGNELKINIRFRSNVDPSKYRYYIIFSEKVIKIPYSTYPVNYFFGPGEDYDKNSMDVSTYLVDYYTRYFITWNDFVLLKDNVYNMTNGPFTDSTLHATYKPSLLDYRSVASGDVAGQKTISVTVYFNRLSSVPPILYFNFAAVDPTGCTSGGYLLDYLRATDNTISTVQGTSITGKIEPQDLSIDGALDITSWDMTIQ